MAIARIAAVPRLRLLRVIRTSPCRPARTFGLPFGTSFFGSAWSEPKLLKIAYAFEHARRARRKPESLHTADLYA
jgi:hypothetical protein